MADELVSFAIGTVLFVLALVVIVLVFRAVHVAALFTVALTGSAYSKLTTPTVWRMLVTGRSGARGLVLGPFLACGGLVSLHLSRVPLLPGRDGVGFETMVMWSIAVALPLVLGAWVSASSLFARRDAGRACATIFPYATAHFVPASRKLTRRIFVPATIVAIGSFAVLVAFPPGAYTLAEGEVIAEIVAEPGEGARGLALDRDHVYWTSFVTPTAKDLTTKSRVRSAPRAGGAPSTLCEIHDEVHDFVPSKLLVDGPSVWVLAPNPLGINGAVYRTTTGARGTDCSLVAPDIGANGIVRVGTTVYVIGQRRGIAVILAFENEGDPRTVAELPSGSHDLVTDEVDLFFNLRDAAGHDRAAKIPVTGGPFTELGPSGRYLERSGDRLLFLRESVTALPLDGGEGAPIGAPVAMTDGEFGADFAVVGDVVYLTTDEGHSVRKGSASGGTFATHSTLDTSLASIVADERDVFVTTRVGAVLRIAP